MNNNLALIDESELSLAGENNLNNKQLQLILKRTPEHYVRERPAKGGGKWRYVTAGYMKKCLNLMFGWDWDFEILDEKILHGEVIVKGRLTCRSGGKTIVKTQYGNKDIMYRKETDKDGNKVPLSIGNDMKSAASDCLKKCASEVGIAADIYNAEEFKEVLVNTSDITYEELQKLYENKKESIDPEVQIHIERILNNRETKSYKKIHSKLKTL